MEYRTGKCSQCGAEYKIPASFAHNQARCKECGGVVHIAGAGARAAPANPAFSAPRPAPTSVAAPARVDVPALAGSREAAVHPREPVAPEPARAEAPIPPVAPPRAPRPSPVPETPAKARRLSPVVPWLVAAAAAVAAALYYFGDTLFA